MTVEIVDLGAWGAASLIAEYDPENDAIRVNAGAVAAIRRALGEGEAQKFIAVAIAHESYHRAHPAASEDEAHAHARATCGRDPARYEAVLRKARQSRRVASQRG